MSYYAAPAEEAAECPVCGEEMDEDIRKLTCGCYAHKTCQKNAPICREHGKAW